MNLRSLTDYLPHFLSRTGETAYVQPHGYRTERWSYQQVAGAAFGFARELEDRDIGEGDRVILWGPNSAEWVAVFWGCVLRGAIVVPLDDIAMPDFFRRVHQQVEAKLLVASRHHQHQAIPTLILEDFVGSPCSPVVFSLPIRRPFFLRYCGNRVHLRHHRRTQGRGDFSRQRTR